MLVVWFAVVFVAGAVAGWLIAHRWFVSERSMAQERSAARENELQAQMNVLKESERQRIAGRAGAQGRVCCVGGGRSAYRTTAALMQLCKSRSWASQQKEAKTDLEMRKQARGRFIAPVKASLAKLGVETSALELKRESAYATVLAEIGTYQQTHDLLRGETNQLVSALRDSVRAGPGAGCNSSAASSSPGWCSTASSIWSNLCGVSPASATTGLRALHAKQADDHRGREDPNGCISAGDRHRGGRRGAQETDVCATRRSVRAHLEVLERRILEAVSGFPGLRRLLPAQARCCSARHWSRTPR